jgi:AraC-like DNA-binding protein
MVQNQRKVQKRMLFAFGLSGVILIGLLSTFTSQILARFLVNQSVDYATQSLEVAVSGTTTLLDDLISEYFFLFNEQPTLQNFSISNPESESNLVQLLSQTALADPLVDNILFYDVQEGSVAFSNGVSGLLDNLNDNELSFALKETLLSISNYPNRLFHQLLINDTHILALTLISYDTSGLVEKMLVIHLNEEALSNLFTGESSNYEILIVNEDNVVIADSAQTWLGVSFPTSLNYTTPLALDESNNYVLSAFNNTRSLIAFSKVTKYNLVFFHVTPYDIIESKLISANRIIIGLFMIFVLINLLVSYALSQQFYKPIKLMINQYVKHDYKYAKDEFELIESAFVDLNASQQTSVLKNLFSASTFDSQLDYSFISFPLRVVVALHQKDEMIHEHWIKMSEGIEATLMKENEIIKLNVADHDIKYGISDICSSLETVRACYRSALAAAQFVDTLENQNLMFYSDIHQSDFLSSKTLLMNSVMTYLAENGFSSSFSFDALADACGFSLGYIRQVFKETQGLAINEYLITMRINKAKEYLETTSMSGKEISEAVGYNESRYFYTQFKQRVNLTIEAYRSKVSGGKQDEK